MTDKHAVPRPEELLDAPDKFLDQLQKKVLYRLNICEKFGHWCLHQLIRCLMILLFRVRVEGLEHLPRNAPLIIAPNHTSTLDPFLLAAVLPYRILKNAWWAGWSRRVAKSRLQKWMSSLTQTLPIEKSPLAVAVGAAVLQADRILIWFPEGHRTEDGRLQEFQRGIGYLVQHFDVPVIPVFLHGGFSAMPRRSRFPRLWSDLSASFGPPLQLYDDRDASPDEITQRLFEAVKDLQEQQQQRSNEIVRPQVISPERSFLRSCKH